MVSLINQVPHLQTPHSAVVLMEALDGNGLIASKKFFSVGMSGDSSVEVRDNKVVISGRKDSIGLLTLIWFWISSFTISFPTSFNC